MSRGKKGKAKQAKKADKQKHYPKKKRKR